MITKLDIAKRLGAASAHIASAKQTALDRKGYVWTQKEIVALVRMLDQADQVLSSLMLDLEQ